MTRTLISTFIFTFAILCGLAIGYGTVKTASFAYHFTTAYVAEVRTDLTFTQPVLGGPAPETIIESDLNKESDVQKTFYITNQDKKPRITGLSYLVADIETGKIILAKNVNQQFPIASITKLMTAVVADETLGLETKTTVNSQAIQTYGTQGELKKGETYSVLELFNPLLLESSNDAAEALAYIKDRESFIADMNGKAKSIGLTNTTFEDASGLSPYNVSSVADLFKLMQYIQAYRNYIFDITVNKKIELGNKTWFSNSRFKNDAEYVGGKNGYTDEALKTQTALFEEDFEGEKRTLAYIVLKSTDVGYDIKMLRNFVYKNVEFK